MVFSMNNNVIRLSIIFDFTPWLSETPCHLDNFSNHRCARCCRTTLFALINYFVLFRKDYGRVDDGGGASNEFTR